MVAKEYTYLQKTIFAGIKSERQKANVVVICNGR
jgi:hypothetical protein